MVEGIAEHEVTAKKVHHEELGWWRKYIFSVDHKVIGIQYGITALAFLLTGFTLMALMRWSLAYPDEPGPWWIFISGFYLTLHKVFHHFLEAPEFLCAHPHFAQGFRLSLHLVVPTF